MKTSTVPLWMIVLIVALPQLSETIYTPVLPALADSLGVSDNLAQYTLTVFLIGFAFGVLCWGRFSDIYGRKPGLYLGLCLYMLASLGCYFARSIEILLLMRFLQAVGASVGSVLGQAIARDAIAPEDRGRAFSMVSIAMAFAPAVGPMIGGFVAHYAAWNFIFLVLFALAAFIVSQAILFLPETNANIGKTNTNASLMLTCMKKMVSDLQILGFGLLVGGVNGILFGYFAESPFFFIDSLDLSSSTYGLLAFVICLPLALGGMISKRMHAQQYTANQIIFWGINTIIAGSAIFYALSQTPLIDPSHQIVTISLSLLMIFIIMSGVTMVIPNCLSQALQNYGEYAGTAASLFGFYYYVLIAAFTALMSYLHNGLLTALPLYFLLMGLLMMLAFKKAVCRNPKDIIAL